MSGNVDYNFCFSSECGYCISCVGGTKCSYKNPLKVYEDATGSEFIHPPPEKSSWEKYRSAMKTLEEAREWLDAQKKKTSPINDYYAKKDKFIEAGCPLDRTHPNYDREVASETIVATLIQLQGMPRDTELTEEISSYYVGYTLEVLLVEYDKITMEKINERKEELVKKYEGKFTEKGKLYKPDFEVDLYEITDAMMYGVRIEGQIWLSNDVGIYNADIQNEIAEMGDEEFEKYFEIFEGYWKEMSVFLEEKNFRWNPDGKGVLGDLPDKIETKNGTYTLIDNIGSQMCDEPTCCSMGHCMMNLENYQGNNPPPMSSEEYAQIFSILPIYTKEHKHELCALCILKED